MQAKKEINNPAKILPNPRPNDNERGICFSCRPLLVIGKGAAFSQADTPLTELAESSGIPFLATAMGRGVIPDTHPNSANAARSLALAKADVAIVFGAR